MPAVATRCQFSSVQSGARPIRLFFQNEASSTSPSGTRVKATSQSVAGPASSHARAVPAVEPPAAGMGTLRRVTGGCLDVVVDAGRARTRAWRLYEGKV